MTPRLTATTAFDRGKHRVEAFSCGQEALDRWLRAYASQNQRRDAARTFVTAAADGKVAGYYTLVAAQVEHEQATAGVRRGLSRHFPIPVALLARLAVATPHQGTGLGRSLLLDALQRVLRASDELAIRAVTVDALDERAAAFYRNFGFEPSDLAPNTLMAPLQAIRRTLSADT
ncbi:MAG TPA: GNAT family N-acetyltransferase [Solirubrobacteraceae bacterium]|nr:GNAT family N-acetyltransferase [Solirubrobacteraceae bacterium]